MDERTARLGHTDFMRQTFVWALLLTLVLCLITPAVGHAQVVTNITSSGLNTQITQTGNVSNITGGTRPGSGPNLFHSFGNFSVGGGDIANFLNGVSFDLNGTPLAAGLPTSNILGRVTGGSISNIYGTIQTTNFGNANLFLVNPSGIVFGPNGSVNVSGSVSFTTAQYLRLFDGINSANFYANPANDGLANSVLAVAPVVEFGFLSPAAYGFLTPPDPSATITVHGSSLSVPSGQSISLVGGKVVIEGATLPDQTVQRAQLSAPNGRILLASTASPGEFDSTTLLAGPNVENVSFTSYGSVSLEAGSSLDVSGTRTVFIKDGQLVLSVNDAKLITSETSAENPTPTDTFFLGPGSSIVTSNSGTEPGPDVQITVGRLSLEGSTIFTGNQGDGVGGNLFLNVGTLSLLGSQITGDTLGTGNGGQVSITATSLSLNDDSTILTSTSGIGRNGAITLSVQDASLSGRSSIVSEPNSTDPAGAAGGKITVQGLLGKGTEANSLTLEGFRAGLIARSFGSALLGDIELHAKTVSVTGGAVIQAGGSFDTGTASNVIIEADSVGISGGGSISSQAFAADAGQVTITADQVSLDSGVIETTTSSPTGGRGGDVVLNVGSLSLANTAAINSSASGTGPAGNINVLASGSVTLTNGSTITASTTGSGNAGQVVLTTPALTVDDATITTSTSSTGNAGGILIQGLASPANSVTITDSSLLTTAENTGQGGSITVTATNLTLNNATISASVKDVPAGGDPKAGVGNIALSASAMTMNGSNVTTESSGSRNAGDISINSKSIPGNTFEMMQKSTINTSAALSDGGNIGIYATNMVRLTDSIITSSVGNETKTNTLGGNVTIDPQFVILQNSQIRANAFAGSGGAIDIIAGVFLADPLSILSVSSTLGVSGTINIQSPVQNVGGRLTPLSQQFSSAAALLAQQCAARAADGKFSTFVVAGREGLPVEPGGFLASPSLTAALIGASLSGRYPHTQFPAVTDSFSEYDARPIQLAKLGGACR